MNIYVWLRSNGVSVPVGEALDLLRHVLGPSTCRMMKNGTVADFRAYAARRTNNLRRGNRGLYRFFIILLARAHPVERDV